MPGGPIDPFSFELNTGLTISTSQMTLTRVILLFNNIGIGIVKNQEEKTVISQLILKGMYCYQYVRPCGLLRWEWVKPVVCVLEMS